MTLSERYPDLDFYLHLIPLTPYELFEEGDGKWNGKKGDSFLYPRPRREPNLRSLSLENLEVIFVCGLGLGDLFYPFKGWLEQDPFHTLIFLEEDLNLL